MRTTQRALLHQVRPTEAFMSVNRLCCSCGAEKLLSDMNMWNWTETERVESEQRLAAKDNYVKKKKSFSSSQKFIEPRRCQSRL